MQQRRALGRGIESLIPNTPTPTSAATPQRDGTGYRTLPLSKLVPNRQQPRTYFDEAKIRELADSLEKDGILQPLVVSPLNDGRFELVAGERRFRAAKLAGLEEVPVVIKKVDSENQLILAILENIQREDLNPIEEAHAYQELVEQFEYSQEEVAKRMGKSRVAITNTLRLLKLPRALQEDVIAGRYTAGHARALLALPSLHDQLKFRETLLAKLPTVRDVERLVQQRSQGESKQRASKKDATLPAQVTAVVEKMKQALGTKVALHPGKEGKGKLVIEYYSANDFDRLARKLTS